VHQVDVSVYVKNVGLISPRQQTVLISPRQQYVEHEGRNDKKKGGRKLLLDTLKLNGIGGRERVTNYRGIFQLGPD
jgi:hypothetical protein